MLINRYFGRPDRDEEEKIIDEIEKSIREKENELRLWTMLQKNKIKMQ